MAAAAENNLLGWVKTDNRRFLNAVIRVADLNRTIRQASTRHTIPFSFSSSVVEIHEVYVIFLEFIRFYTECFGMKLLSKKEFPEEKYSKAVVGFGPVESSFVLELIHVHGVEKYEIGTAFGHFGIATQDIYTMVEKIRAFGAVITREPGTMGGGRTVFAFVEDPNGYSFELLQRQELTPEPLCQIMLSVLDLDRAISFYEKGMGMKVLQKYDSPEAQFAIAMVGYGSDQTQTTVIELKYNYNVTEYTEGDGYVLASFGTDDVFRSAAAVKSATGEFGGMIISPPGPAPETGIKSTAFLDPDGFKTVLVDNEDYLKGVKDGL